LEGAGATTGAEPAASAAASLRAQALEAAETRPGRLNDEPFDWIADADARLGPVCEAFIDGKYYWLPFERIASVTIAPPDDLIDLVWTSAELVFDNQGVKQALIPTRYPGTEAIDDDALRAARRTEWVGSDATGWHGIGQRELLTDRREIGLCDVRSLVLG
jgi:type VI secretion system protein ImpE